MAYGADIFKNVIYQPGRRATGAAARAARQWLATRPIPKKALDVSILTGGAMLAPGALTVLGNIYGGGGQQPVAAVPGAPGDPEGPFPPAPVLPSREELDRQEQEQEARDRGQTLPPLEAPAPRSERPEPETGPIAEKGLDELAELLKMQLSPEYQQAKLQREVQAQLFQRAVADASAMEKSREKTRREIEKQVLQSWQARETALINRDAAILMGMGQMVGSVYPADALKRGADLLKVGDINIPKVF
jgi:hypothetical protein